MRRRLGLVQVGLVVCALLVAPVTAASAADERATPTVDVVLAAEGAEEELGPAPQPRKAEENPARELAGYEDRETPFTWGAAWILTFAGVVGLLLLGGLYQLLVRRPARESAVQR